MSPRLLDYSVLVGDRLVVGVTDDGGPGALPELAAHQRRDPYPTVTAVGPAGSHLLAENWRPPFRTAARFVVPAGYQDRLVFTYQVNAVQGYRLTEPDDAPRRLTTTLTAAQWDALANTANDEDRGYYQADWQQVGEQHQHLVLAELQALPPVAEMTAEQWGYVENASALGWKPDQAHLDVYGHVLAPWLPGHLAVLSECEAEATARGWTWRVEAGRTVTLSLQVAYSPPVFGTFGTRARPQRREVRTHATLTIPSGSIPEVVTGRDLYAALERRHQYLVQFTTWLDQHKGIHACGTCKGQGYVFPEQTPPPAL